jgi:hypothetical protein
MLAHNPCTGKVRPINAMTELTPEEDVYHGGHAAAMTLRDHFAAAALQGYFANEMAPHRCDGPDVAEYCYRMADAMLLARRGA